MSDTEEKRAAPSLEEIVYDLVMSYAQRKLASKASPDKSRDSNERKEKIAREAFFAVRSRSGADFADYFVSTICSVPQYLHNNRFPIIARALRDPEQRAEVRTLTLLALSAVSWSPSARAEDNHPAAEK